MAKQKADEDAELAKEHRLHDSGSFRRICRGIYDYPAYSALLQASAGPDMDAVACAIARKFKWQI
ncbi:MAG: hypothetical protein J6S53_11075 [Lentisphaeria bacterium]|nr:hypothetical protein [Lentisphaeria bacterium]